MPWLQLTTLAERQRHKYSAAANMCKCLLRRIQNLTGESEKQPLFSGLGKRQSSAGSALSACPRRHEECSAQNPLVLLQSATLLLFFISSKMCHDTKPAPSVCAALYTEFKVFQRALSCWSNQTQPGVRLNIALLSLIECLSSFKH